MKNILIIGFYELKEYLTSVVYNLEFYNYTVFSYPLFRYAYDQYDKIENFDKNLSDYIKNNNIEIVLWWFIDVSPSVFELVKKNNPQVYFIMNNSSDPLNMGTE